MMAVEAVIILLTDEQLAAEIVDAEAQVCCASLLDASRAMCGCGGRAASYLARLRGEAVRRADEHA